MLSSDQDAVLEQFIDFVMDDDAKELVISGAAGCGKTYLTSHLLKQANKSANLIKLLDSTSGKINVFLTATTNKAARVLARNNPGRDVTTIHSLLGLKVTNDYKTGKTRLRSTGNSVADLRKALVFVEEASMVNAELLQIIRENTKNSKVVYIGDDHQLSPVKENVCPVFNCPLPQQAKLTKIHRQGINSPIIDMAHAFRQVLDTQQFPKVEDFIDNKNIFLLDGDQLKEELDNNIHNFTDLSNHSKIMAWSNNKVIQYNKYIRSHYTNKDTFEPGELVTTNTPIQEHTGVISAVTDQLLRIHAVEDGEEYDVEGQWITFSNGVKVFNPNDHLIVKKLIKEESKLQMSKPKEDRHWMNYFKLKNFFADLRSAHACTVHKAQGETFEQVFIDLGDIGRNTKWNEIARLVYVAVTRAKERVYLYDSLPKRLYR